MVRALYSAGSIAKVLSVHVCGWRKTFLLSYNSSVADHYFCILIWLMWPTCAFIWQIHDCNRNRQQPYRRQISPNTSTEYNEETKLLSIHHYHRMETYRETAPWHQHQRSSWYKILQSSCYLWVNSSCSIFPHSHLLPSKHLKHTAVNRNTAKRTRPPTRSAIIRFTWFQKSVVALTKTLPT